MKVNVPVNAIVEAVIDERTALDILLQVTQMKDLVWDDDLYVKEDEHGDKVVYRIVDGHDETVDDRGDLLIALRNVVCALFPNLDFRGEDYIHV